MTIFKFSLQLWQKLRCATKQNVQEIVTNRTGKKRDSFKIARNIVSKSKIYA